MLAWKIPGTEEPGGLKSMLCHHAHRCVRLGDTTFYKNYRLHLIRPVGLWMPEDLKQVHMAPRTEEAARAQATTAVGQIRHCAGGSGPIKATIPAKDPEGESLSFKIFKCTLKKRRRSKECLKFQLSSKHHCSQNLVNFKY